MSRWRHYIHSLPWRLSYAVPMAIGGYWLVVETTASTPKEGVFFGAVLAFICLWPGKRGRYQAVDEPSTQDGGDGDGGD